MRNENEKVIAEFKHRSGWTVMVVHFTDVNLYNTYEDGILKQYDLTAEDVIRWLAHTNHVERIFGADID